MSNALVGSSECCVESSPKQVTIKDGLLAKKDRLEKQLAEVNEALAAVEAHPEVIKLFDLITKAGRY